ncbi:MAG TPA: pyridoxamine 5'-phosphate oxidase family protein [Thermoplasmata archaeon]|jgi:uncharacterized protein YhbP (UPF0306 family)|nr:pyridoxamine 5'-phosphate oxidase family protein [Thermoplasmata archaeon]
MSLLKTVTKSLTSPPVRRSVARILRENVLCSMSTLPAGPGAHINTAYFCVSPALEIFFLSDPESRHCRNLARNPSMAMAIFRSDQAWGDPNRGLQLFGSTREATGAVAAKGERLYGTRFPPYRRWIKEGGREAAQLRSYRFYRFVPRRLKILDEQEFGGGVFVEASVPRGRRLF